MQISLCQNKLYIFISQSCYIFVILCVAIFSFFLSVKARNERFGKEATSAVILILRISSVVLERYIARKPNPTSPRDGHLRVAQFNIQGIHRKIHIAET